MELGPTVIIAPFHKRLFMKVINLAGIIGEGKIVWKIINRPSFTLEIYAC